ncbi:MAG: type IV pilus assembly protein PilM [Verrucomicrobiota bacterium]|nr:type IV pilus assembly protein PilM [Verrucomicrobiota bacterium]
MLQASDYILAVDIGASSIKLAEFAFPDDDTIVLTKFVCKGYDLKLAEADKSIQIATLLKKILIENDFASNKVLVCVSGQSAFIRFVQLPPVSGDESRVRQIVEYEARQNVPFSMDQVIWDYQLIGEGKEGEELDVMFVVIKNDIVEKVTNAVQAVGLEPLLVDVPPSAIYNAARANNLGMENCIMLLDIGGRSSNLIFIEGNKFFARTIPIAGHSITQQIAKEFGISFEEANELKHRHGFVALGGAYEEPESEVAAIISKIVRNVMARLHGEINRSISVYASQQKGSRPTKLYLAGGSSILPFTERFFAEKLRVETSYFNPFQVVLLAPEIKKQELEEVAHTFGAVIGMGVRHNMECPVEINIIPEQIRKQQFFAKKKPYLLDACALFILLFSILFYVHNKQAKEYKMAYDFNKGNVTTLEGYARKIEDERFKVQEYLQNYDRLEKILRSRQGWSGLINELQTIIPSSMLIESGIPIIGEIKVSNKKEEKKDVATQKDEEKISRLFGTSSQKEKKNKKKAKGTFDKIGGITITGYTLIFPINEKMEIKSKDRKTIEKMTPKLKKENIFENKTNKVNEKKYTSPERDLLKKLEKSTIFAKNGSTIMTYSASDKHRNLSYFSIRLKLKSPISLEKL